MSRKLKQKGLLVAAGMMLGATQAAAVDPFELEQVDIHYKRFAPGGRNPLFFSTEQKEELNFGVMTRVARFGFLNLKLHSMTDQFQFHVAGLNFTAGVRVFPWLDIQTEHFSRHILDTSYPHQGFPVEDSVGLRLYLYRAKQGGSIFGGAYGD